MFKRDPIFWIATGIFVAGIAIYGFTQNQVWLFLLVGSYLLRPTLASLNIAKSKVDERQMSIQYRSGNIAFAVMIIGCIVMHIYEDSRNDHAWEFFDMIIIIGLAAKALSNVFLIGNYRESATKILLTVGLIVVLFATLEEGLSIGSLMNSLPGIIIIAIGLLSKKFPKSIGVVVLAVTAALAIMIVTLKGRVLIAQITTALLISVPLAIAGISLIVGDRKAEADNAVE